MNTINSFAQSLQMPSLSPANTNGVGEAQDAKSFKNFLLESIHEVNSMQQDADKAVENMMSGGEANPAEVLTAVQKADIAFRMMIQVRNKMVAAYDEVKSIRV